ncbi:MAG: glucose/arabinose dehydrogenase, partial [Cellvibrionaceae bacterium]
RGGRHFGGRLLFDRQNFLFISLGDRGQRAFSQRLDSHHGSVICLHNDGRVPIDNPFVNQPGARPEIFTYGHRNVQGMTLHPQTDEVWIHEHGPQGGDEVNLLQAGKNYGWPVITYGVEYVSGLKIGEGIRKPGMEQPLHFWDPSIAPSGMAFYRGDLWVGALKYQLLAQLTFKEDLLLKEQRHFQGRFGRIRDVRNFSDDRQQPALYLLTGASNGQLIRIDYD